MAHYRNPYASSLQHHQELGRFRSAYPYGESPLSQQVERQYLLPDTGSPYGLDPYHRGETLPLQPLGPRTTGYLREHDREPFYHRGPGTWERPQPPRRELIPKPNVTSTLDRGVDSLHLLPDPGPVKLAPCWESRNATNDELNFRPLQPAKSDEVTPPKDRFNAVYLILVLHGIGILMPWNMFITANSYFVDFKLSPNHTYVESDEMKEYQGNFLSYLGVASQVPNVLCNALNLFVQIGGGSLTCRIVTSIIIEVIVFIVTVILAMLDTATWPGAFFYTTMASVVVLNMANGIYQNSVYGTAAKLPMKYSNAVVLGSNISGTLTAVISIVSMLASPSLRTAAIYYFLTALFVLLLCFDTYFVLPLCKYYRHFDRIARKINNQRASRPPYWLIFKKIWPQCFNVFFIFFVTLSIFPAVQANIKPVDSDFIVKSQFFAPITCFLNFNFFAMIGNIFPNWIRFPGPRFLWLPVVLRALLIPFFMLCNYKPDTRVLPVLIDNDWAYVGVGSFLGLSSGYFSSLAMMYAPGYVQPEYAATAGMMSAVFLILGIMVGLNFSFFISWLVETRLF